MSTSRLPLRMAAMPGPHGLLGDPAQLVQLGGVALAHEDGERGVPVPAVDDRAGVDGEQVAVLEDGLLVGDAVHDDVVHRGADVAREAAVAEEVGLGAVVGEHLRGDLVQILGAGARDRGGPARVVHRGDDQPRLAHLRDLLRGLDLHHATVPFLVSFLRRYGPVPARRPTGGSQPVLHSVCRTAERPRPPARAPRPRVQPCSVDEPRHSVPEPLPCCRASIARSVTSPTLPSAEIVVTRS